MNRYSIVGIMPEEQIKNINIIQSDSIVVEIELIKNKKILNNGLGEFIAQLANLGLSVDNKAVELGIISTLVNAGDTKISRDDNSQDSWTREIDLYIPVNDVLLWNQNKALLQTILNFLSGDKWRLIFRQIKESYTKFLPTVQPQLEIKYDCVSLFSGGLDSFIGAIDLLSQGKKPLLISHYYEGATSKYQTACITALEEKFPENLFKRLYAYIGFDYKTNLGQEPENSLRARSFLFFSLAVLAASTLNNKQVYVPENGLISINVPLNILRSGALSTRTTHPYYMAKFQKLLNQLNLVIQLENPYRFKTKGEMARDCLNNEVLAEHYKNTISCASPGKGRWQGDSALRHCGYCLPCIIRRASINAAFREDETDYRLDLNSVEILDSGIAEGYDYKSFQFAIEEMEENIDNLGLTIRIPGSLEDYSDEEIKEYIGVYRRGMLEVKNLVGNLVVK